MPCRQLAARSWLGFRSSQLTRVSQLAATEITEMLVPLFQRTLLQAGAVHITYIVKDLGQVSLFIFIIFFDFWLLLGLALWCQDLIKSLFSSSSFLRAARAARYYVQHCGVSCGGRVCFVGSYISWITLYASFSPFFYRLLDGFIIHNYSRVMCATYARYREVAEIKWIDSVFCFHNENHFIWNSEIRIISKEKLQRINFLTITVRRVVVFEKSAREG